MVNPFQVARRLVYPPLMVKSQCLPAVTRADLECSFEVFEACGAPESKISRWPKREVNTDGCVSIEVGYASRDR